MTTHGIAKEHRQMLKYVLVEYSPKRHVKQVETPEEMLIVYQDLFTEDVQMIDALITLHEKVMSDLEKIEQEQPRRGFWMQLFGR